LSWPIFLPVLEKLHLQDNALALIPAATLCNLPLLTHLDVSFNAITAIEHLRGLRHLPALSVLNLNDNPVYTSAASEARQGEANQLHAFLTHECLSLRVLSGTALQRPTVSAQTPLRAGRLDPAAAAVTTQLVVSKACAENVWELGGLGLGPLGLGSLGAVLRSAEATPDPPSADTDRLANSKHLYDMLAEFRSGPSAVDGARWHWPRYHAVPPLHHQLHIRALHDAHNESAHPGASNEVHGGLANTSQSSRAFVQLLQGLCATHNVLRAREKNDTVTVKRAEGAPNTCAPPTAVEDPRGLWEQRCTQQLLEHTQAILSWGVAGNAAGSAETRLISMQATGPTAAGASAPVVLRLASFADMLSEEDGADAAPDALPHTSTSDTSDPPPEVGPTTPAAATWQEDGRLSKAQAAWRGYRLRKQVKGIVASSRYCDDELDELFQTDALEGLDMGLDGYDDLLNPMGLRGDWHQTGGEGMDEEGERDEEGEGEVTASFVYGDHRRRGSFARSRGSAVGERPSIYSDRTDPDTHTLGAMPWPPVSRPSTSLTDTSSLSAASSRAHTEPDPDSMSLRSHSAQYGDGDGAGAGAGIAELYGDRGAQSTFSPTKSPRHRADALSEEWGITDPKVLQAMQKRNKRMKAFATAKESREKEKDPEVRYQRFVKNSFKTTAGATSPAGGGGAGAGAGGSGGRGNAGSHMGTGRGRGGRFGGGARRTIPMPAWALGSTDNDNNET
jgi:hypothetical protein